MSNRDELLHIDAQTEKVAFLGDTHGRVDIVITRLKQAYEQGARCVFHVGDYTNFVTAERHDAVVSQFLVENHMQMWLTLGNHDDYSLLREVGERSYVEVAPSLYVFNRPAMFTTNDTLMLSVSGAGSINKEHLTPNKTWFAQEAVTSEDVRRVEDIVQRYGSPDIMVTHDAPKTPRLDYLIELFGLPVARMFGYRVLSYCQDIQEMVTRTIETAQPKQLFHGHHHMRYDTEFNGTSVHGLSMEDEAGAMVVVRLSDGAITYEAPSVGYNLT